MFPLRSTSISSFKKLAPVTYYLASVTEFSTSFYGDLSSQICQVYHVFIIPPEGFRLEVSVSGKSLLIPVPHLTAYIHWARFIQRIPFYLDCLDFDYFSPSLIASLISPPSPPSSSSSLLSPPISSLFSFFSSFHFCFSSS